MNLPVDEPPLSPVSPAAVAERILVVDDTEANRDTLARRLQRRGYAIETAADGPSALRAIEAANPPFDLVLLDVMMPGMSGLEVLERLRLTYPPSDLPVVMATAKDESADIVDAMTRGANDYVTKPIDFPVMLARLQTHLALRASIQQTKRLERELSDRNAALERANADLEAAAALTRRDLALGARVQASMLPNTVREVDGLTFAWAFRPCEHLAGDALNICPIAPGVAGVYVLDVVGHGVASSLLSVTAMRALGNGGRDGSMLVGADGAASPPADVAAALNEAFPFNIETGQFFTFYYALLDANANQLKYVSAGHPGAILLPKDGDGEWLNRNGTPIGVGGGHVQHEHRFEPGARLVLYSDGVIEATRADGERFGVERLLEFLANTREVPLADVVESLLATLDTWRGGQPSHDDVTIVAVERTRNV